MIVVNMNDYYLVLILNKFTWLLFIRNMCSSMNSDYKFYNLIYSIRFFYWILQFIFHWYFTHGNDHFFNNNLILSFQIEDYFNIIIINKAAVWRLWRVNIEKSLFDKKRYGIG